MLDVVVISLFPAMFSALNYGVTAKALAQGKLNIKHLDLRDFADNAYHGVDDRPFGGGPGMLLKPKPLLAAIAAAKHCLGTDAKVIYLSPQGKKISQADLGLAKNEQKLIFLAGRYEGIDERVIDLAVDLQWSIGDYVLSGGELAVMVVLDALARLLPGVLGNCASALAESFIDDLLDYPQYTRPRVLANLAVPEVLLSGNHAAISAWRLEQQLKRTLLRRPDLLANRVLSAREQELLQNLKKGENDE